MARTKRKKKKMPTIKIVLITVGVFVVLFTAICLWLFYVHQAVPDSLIVAVFGAVFGEVSICGWIKTIKTKYKESEGDIDDL